VRLSAVIMAHRTRQTEAEELQASLDRPVDIIYDKVPTPSADPAQRWANATRCWEAADPDADWHLVIQDDAIAAPDLLAGLEKALDVLGTEGLMSAYTGTGKPHQGHVRTALHNAHNKGHAWMSTRSLCWGVAIIAPVHTIPGMLRWCGRPARSTRVNYDMSLGQYYRDTLGWRTWYTVPSLVDHRDGPSLVGHGATGVERRAHAMHTDSALLIDWTRTPAGGLTVRH